MGTKFDLTGLPLEVFGLVLEHLFGEITIKTETPSQLSRFNRIVKERPDLSIFEVLKGDRHRLAKTRLLKAAYFQFTVPCNLANLFSSFFKVLDRISKLTVDYAHLYAYKMGELAGPYKYVGATNKTVGPYETAELYTRRKSLRVLKINMTFSRDDTQTYNLPQPRDFRQYIDEVLSRMTFGARDGSRDILRLGREKISNRCDVVLDLTFSKKNNGEERHECRAMISGGCIISLTSASDKDALEAAAELNDWFKPTSTK